MEQNYSKMDFLVIGYNVRGLAEQIYISGNNVCALDFFIDTDFDILNSYRQKSGPSLTYIPLFKNKYYPDKMVKYVCGIKRKFDGIVYTSNLENYPELVYRLERRDLGSVMGNNSKVLKKINLSLQGDLYDFLKDTNISFPDTYLPEGPKIGNSIIKTDSLIKKPYLSGGGLGIQEVDSINFNGKRKYYFQQYISGTPGSALFVANGKQAELFGITEQLLGTNQAANPEKNLFNFLYCGNVITLPSVGIRDKLRYIANCLTEYFGLYGLNGIDFIIKDGEIYFLELNPRFTAAMELFYFSNKKSLFNYHLQGVKGILPDIKLDENIAKYWGKRIIYAGGNVEIINDLSVYFNNKNDPDIILRDIPGPGEKINRNRPITTIIANGSSKVDVLNKIDNFTFEVLKNCFRRVD